jgi:hypothetical protein
MSEHYEVTQLRFGEFCVIIEFCSKCKNHNNSLRHDETKYLSRAMQLKNIIQEEFPFIKIYLKPLQEDQSKNLKKLGLFEIYFASFEKKELILIGSKLKTLKWPKSKIVLNNLREKFEGKMLNIKLKKNEWKNFHPSCNLSKDIKTVLCTAVDFKDILNTLIEQKKNRKTKSAKKILVKERKLSSIVTSKIQTGLLHKEEIDDLLFNKKIEAIQFLDQNGCLKFVNIKPGNYKLIVFENKNVKDSVFDIKVDPYLREKDSIQENVFSLSFKEESFVEFSIGFCLENPVIKLGLKKISENCDNISQMEEEIKFIKNKENLDSSSQRYSIFKSNELFQGFYEFFLEYKNYEVFKKTVFIFKGYNFYQIDFPDFKINYDFEKDPHFDENLDTKKKAKNIESLSQKENSFSQYEDNKENIVNEHQTCYNKKTSGIQNPNADKEEIKREPFASKKDSFKSEENSFYNKKNRVQSGNRIRPGERLPSTKSNKIPHPINEEIPRMCSFIKTFNKKDYKDGVWENFKKEKDTINLFIKINNTVETQMDFFLDGEEEIDQNNVIRQDLEGSYEKLVLKYVKDIKLGRIFVKLKTKEFVEDFDVYVDFGEEVKKIDLSGFLKKFLKNDEAFCDLCIITNDLEKERFNIDTFLVPMENEISCITGLFEIRNLVNFVNNSKFPVSKFFGFEENFEEDDQDKDYTINIEQSIEALKNYELYCDSSYILNSIRYEKSHLLSLKNLQQIYPRWEKIIYSCMDLVDQLENEEEDDEQFEGEEFDREEVTGNNEGNNEDFEDFEDFDMKDE